jgi:hypothetical protein
MKTAFFAYKTQSRHGLIARLLDQAQAGSRLVVSLDELVELSGLTPLAVERQLEHLGKRVMRLPGRPSVYLLVALEHRARGAPPVASWLGAYFGFVDSFTTWGCSQPPHSTGLHIKRSR